VALFLAFYSILFYFCAGELFSLCSFVSWHWIWLKQYWIAFLRYMFNFRVFVIFPDSFLLLISGCIPLWSAKIFDLIWILNSLRRFCDPCVLYWRVVWCLWGDVCSSSVGWVFSPACQVHQVCSAAHVPCFLNDFLSVWLTSSVFVFYTCALWFGWRYIYI
jgi:hypothetical protein